eukprot:Protomagalhaensia_wolfi_Nauph_80__2548@NODE_2707_length_1010_cov_695_075180_g2119_i0_p1_GENE_NODE_2707_length_1010_cov_695_075180_g2119_i0NODE_2707_length_1010_cov_695_075180_g2119_i0_p1_ORF_typecomplete_len237_score46_35Proteasome/PF00227_26/9_1e54Proteasome_A_N/PF10584_9/4_1e06Proteasome_A_N/PF10584_9/1_8e02Proteasome_A_N/PF10584_9/4e03_NODE_2707_length_1010_cov_695_075180_g2119_i027737
MSSYYGFCLSPFSPTGKLVQIEYALNAVNKQGRPALGIRAKDGVVICSEKKLGNSIIDEGSLHKVEEIADHIGCVYAGMPADFRVILARARKEAIVYEKMFGEPIPTLQLVKTIATIMQEFTQSGGVRPFGVSLLVAGIDNGNPRLFQVDPSGAYFAWKATAIGRDMQNAKTFLERRYNPQMELEDAIHTAILTVKETFEGALNETNIEIGVIGINNRKFKIFTPDEIKDYLGEVE